MHVDPDFRKVHVLSDGTRVTLRMIEPGDKDELKRQLARLSPESRYRRFFRETAALSDEMLTYLTTVDGKDHVAIVATVESLDLKREEGVGVGRFLRLAGEPHVAEAAVTVVDDYQRRGIGKILMETLAEAARERGIHTFRGEILSTNEPMLHLCEEAGAVLHEQGDGSATFDVPLEPHTEAAPLRVLRAIASSMVVLLSQLHPRPHPAARTEGGDAPPR